jgi:phosphoglucosamine mutase
MTAGDGAARLGHGGRPLFHRGDHRHRVVIGKDTRLSGYMIENALTAGLHLDRHGRDADRPAADAGRRLLTRSLRADLGVMISASHNPFEDNGIKLFGPDGFKLSDALEARSRRDGVRLAARLRRSRRRDRPRERLEDARGPLHRERQEQLPARPRSTG